MKTRLTLRIFCLSLLLAGCVAPKGTTVPPKEITTFSLLGTSAPLAPTGMLSPTTTTEISTATLTLLATPAPTRRPTATHTSTPLPSWTPLPTLPPDKAWTLVADLLENNAGCMLPCWWGITPGETTWQQALNFLSQFDSGIYVTGKTEQLQFANVRIPLLKKLDYAYNLFQDYTIQDGIVHEIEVFNYDLAPNYRLANFLAAYGLPDEVWMGAYPDPDQGLKPSLTLFYNQGFAVVIYDGGVDETEEKFIFCTQGDWPYLHMWSPDRELSFQEAAEKWFYKPEEWRFLSIEEATGMTITDFYQNATGSAGETCLVTARGLWP